MFCSSMQRADIDTSELVFRLSHLLGHTVHSIERMGGGRNSQVYRLSCEGSKRYVAKLYFRHSGDERDRLEVESSALRFLWENGIGSIPRPIAVDRDVGFAIYEYIEGQKISAQEVTDSEIDDAVEFLVRLEGLKGSSGSKNLPLASEACFSVQAVIQNIEHRLSRLKPINRDDAPCLALRGFLTKDFVPSFAEITKWCRSSLKHSGISFESDLPLEERTLSPSDFGFHNALRRCSDGRIIFLDFEYFGWDDPAKMISDFVLHPAMDLEEGLKRRFVGQMLTRFREKRYLGKRVESLYPLFGLKWCLILLNEFVPEDLLRRGFATGEGLHGDKVLAEQLARAARMLDRIRREYEEFPYRD